MEVPKAYRGREQSFLKHRVLAEYLSLWSHKIGSLARKGPVTLWYVDCFAGPWQSQNTELRDTSIDIGLQALEQAAADWRQRGYAVDLRAFFVEKGKRSFGKLQEYLQQRTGLVETVARHGEFGDRVPEIVRCLGNDPAFIFIDPTGFKGVAMKFIAPLTKARMRDVLINVMFNDINRFKDDPRQFLREQMRDFFGLGDDTMPPGLAEDELLALYRRRLKENCGLTYAADLAVPHPTYQRTWFRLVIGGKHAEVLNVFRTVERKVAGGEAAGVRTIARQQAEEERSGQLALGLSSSSQHDRWYQRQNQKDQQRAIAGLREMLRRTGRRTFSDVWPELLEEHHVTRSELTELVVREAKRGALRIEPERPRRRSIEDDEWLVCDG
jgi:three-Cys-motif partner protein